MKISVERIFSILVGILLGQELLDRESDCISFETWPGVNDQRLNVKGCQENFNEEGQMRKYYRSETRILCYSCWQSD